jgi:hypothetical protein
MQDLNDLIANVEEKRREQEASAGKAELVAISGHKTYDVRNRTMKGKKVTVPGQTGKVKMPDKVQLQVGSLGLKVMDGDTQLMSLLLHKLTSWESDEKVLKLQLTAEGGGKEELIEFTTSEGPVICEQILTFAAALAKQKKLDKKKAAEEAKRAAEELAQKSEAEQAEQKAKEAAAKEKAEKEAQQAQAKATEQQKAQEAAIQKVIGEKLHVCYTVDQKFWGKPSRLVNGKKVADSVTLKISASELSFEDPGNGSTIKPWLIDTVAIHNIVSWKTVKQTMTISVRKGTLTSSPEYEGAMDFGTTEGITITAVLFKVAAELAAAKKAEKLARKRREKEKAEAEEREAAEAKQRAAMQLQDTVAELYLDTLRQFKVNDLLTDTFAAYDGNITAPEDTDLQSVDAAALASGCVGADVVSAAGSLQKLSWAKASAGQPVLSDAEVSKLLGVIQAVSDTTPEFVESACLALVHLIAHGSDGAGSVVVAGDGAKTAVEWISSHADSTGACRAILALLGVLIRADGQAATEQAVTAGAMDVILKLVTDRTPEPKDDQPEPDTTLYSNPKFMPDVDVLEKALHCLAMITSFQLPARKMLVEANGMEVLLTLIKRVQTPMLMSCTISGVLGALVDSRNVYREDDPASVDSVVDIARRIESMAEAEILEGLVACLDCSVTDVTIGSIASLLLRMLKSERKDAVAEFMFNADSRAVVPAEKLVATLNQMLLKRKSESLSVSFLMFTLGYLAACKDEYKEKIIGMGVLKSVIKAMMSQPRSKMIQESSLLCIHMLTSNLPDDVHEMLPGYMGISVEDIRTERGDSLPASYKCVRKAGLRAEAEMTSDALGAIATGTTVVVTESFVNHLGQTRVKCIVPPVTPNFSERNTGKVKTTPERIGWTSIETVDGTALLERLPDDDLEEAVAEKMLAVMTRIFTPLNLFSADDAMAAAAFHAAKTLCSRNDQLKDAVCEAKKPITWMVKAMISHSNHATMAEGACMTVSNLVSSNRSNQKTIRNTDVAEGLANVLDLHSDNVEVVLAAFGCIKMMLSYGEKSQEAFLKRLAEKDCLALLDSVLKEHQGASKSILELGLGIRTKLSKFMPEPTPDPKQARLGTGRRASLSVFALPPPAESKKKDSAQLGAVLEEDEAEDDAYEQLTRDLMNDMFQVKQSHIKKAPKLVQLQVGSMGLTFYDKDMKPLQNLLFMKLNSWTATSNSVDLFITTPGNAIGKKTVLKVDSATTAHGIVTLMEKKAVELAAQQKRKRKYPIKQSHLTDAASDIHLQIGEKSVLLIDDKDKVVQEIELTRIESWVRDNSSPSRVVVKLTVKEEDGEIQTVELVTEKASLILKQLDDRAEERQKATEEAVIAAEMDEPEPETSASVEEGVPPVGHDDDAGAIDDGEGVGVDDVDGEDGADDDDDDGEDKPDDDEEDEEEDEEEDGEEDILQDFTVIQDHAKGSRAVTIGLSAQGLSLSEKGDPMLYSFTNLHSWTSTSKQCQLLVSAGAGTLTSLTFKTPEASKICRQLQTFACVAARRALLSQLPGSSIESPYVSADDAELALKLQQLQEENRKLAEARAAAAPASTAGGTGVQAEMAAALKAAQAELQSVKRKLDAARASQQRQQKADDTEGTDQTNRIVDLERQCATQAKELAASKAEVATAKEEGAKGAQDMVTKARAETDSWKRKCEAAEALVKSMQSDDSAAALTAMAAEKSKLADKVEKLTEQGKKAMSLLQVRVSAWVGDCRFLYWW